MKGKVKKKISQGFLTISCPSPSRTHLEPHSFDQPSNPLVVLLDGSLERRTIDELLDEREQNRDDDGSLLWKVGIGRRAGTNEKRQGQFEKKKGFRSCVPDRAEKRGRTIVSRTGGRGR